MAGGMTFSEMRSVYEISSKYNADVLLGSSSTLTAREFTDDLSSHSRFDDIEVDEF